MPKERIGLMGGSFNPIHLGHLCMAEAAYKSASLQKILFIISGNPPHKKITAVSSEQRYQMVVAATNQNKAFSPSRIEIDREGIIYSIDTLTLLKKEYPNAELCFLIGEDTLKELTSWCQYEAVFTLCTFLVFRRPIADDLAHGTYQQMLIHMRSMGATIEEVPMPPLAISSTDIRNQLAIKQMQTTLPTAVQAYIGALGLYGYPAWLENASPMVDKLFLALSHDRFAHSLNVCLCARELAKCHGVNEAQATLSALLHDCAKCIPKHEMAALAMQHNLTSDPTLLSSPSLLHSLAGEYLAKVEYHIRDEAVLAAIACHTVGRKNMSRLDQVIYLADKIEASRDPYEGLDALRLLAKTDLSKAVMVSLKSTIKHLKAKDKPIHPAIFETLSFLHATQIKGGSSMEHIDLAQKVASILYGKKAQDIVALSVNHLTVITDYMVIASGHSALQVKALAEEVDGLLAKEGIQPRRQEGHNEGRWIVIDYASVIVHIFHQEERGYYHLERLWDDGSNTVTLPFDQSIE